MPAEGVDGAVVALGGLQDGRLCGAGERDGFDDGGRRLRVLVGGGGRRAEATSSWAVAPLRCGTWTRGDGLAVAIDDGEAALEGELVALEIARLIGGGCRACRWSSEVGSAGEIDGDGVGFGRGRWRRCSG